VIALIDYHAGNLTSVKKALASIGAEVMVPSAPEELADAAGVIVPGVGHFGATRALQGAWTEAILARVGEGRPLLGICLGMQWLYEGSDEAPDVPGLGLLGGQCYRLGEVRLKPDTTDSRMVRLKPDTTDSRMGRLEPDTADSRMGRLEADTTDSRMGRLEADTTDSRMGRLEADTTDSRMGRLEADTADSRMGRLEADTTDSRMGRLEADTTDNRSVRLQADRYIKVPHVGWNSLSIRQQTSMVEGVPQDSQVYFTHSYVGPVNGDTVAVTDHGGTFAAIVQRGHVAGVQFHPEKSGDVGLRILRNFIELVA
jgi:imidazoleglycerol phosphate synthase glutamine amidotransferase subunit HisH